MSNNEVKVSCAHDEVIELRRKLARSQAFNKSVTRHLYSLIEITKRMGAPNAVTLIAACEQTLKASWQAGEEAERD